MISLFKGSQLSKTNIVQMIIPKNVWNICYDFEVVQRIRKNIQMSCYLFQVKCYSFEAVEIWKGGNQILSPCLNQCKKMCGKLVSNRRPSEWKSNAFIVVPLGDMYSQLPNKRGGWENGKKSESKYYK